MNAFLTRGAATALLCLWLPAAATEPVRTREWQPLPAARMALPVLPTPWWVAPGRAPAAAQPQWVQIDPATGSIVPATIPIPLRPEMLGAPLQPMELRVNAQGYVYIDTSGYVSVVSATLDDRGELHAGCNDVGHRHAPQDVQPDASPGASQ